MIEVVVRLDSLWRGDFVGQVSVDVEQDCAFLLVDDVLLKDLVVEGPRTRYYARHDVWLLFTAVADAFVSVVVRGLLALAVECMIEVEVEKCEEVVNALPLDSYNTFESKISENCESCLVIPHSRHLT